MIVFWRLFLAYFLTDFVFFHRTAQVPRPEHKLRNKLLHAVAFIGWGLLLCYGYLAMEWPFLELVNMPGWVCIVCFALFHVCTEDLFDLGGKIKHGYLTGFCLKTLVNLLFLFLCVPFEALYHTGSFFVEQWVIFCVGLVCATRVLGRFLYAMDQDRFGQLHTTFDERWMLMTVRAIFFLIMLLPGWRWTVLLVVWFSACLYARNIRLLDISKLTFYAGMFGATLLGLLVRLRFYYHG